LFLHSKCGFSYDEIDTIPIEYCFRLYKTYIEQLNERLEMIADLFETDPPDSNKPNVIKPNRAYVEAIFKR